MPTLTTTDGHTLDAYEVNPEGATASIVIIQEIFGINPHIRSMVDRYAEWGYRAIAPAVFDRVERKVELQYNPDGMAAGRGIVAEMSLENTMLDVAAAVDHVAETGPVAVVGYCYGGSIAWLSTSELPIAAAVGYYGGMVNQFKDRTPQVPVMLHFGALDDMIPLDGIHEVAAIYPNVPIHIYDDAGHGFNCDARGSYHPESSALAQERTLDFLRNSGVA
jgi:carboxymethylenebutenolidase